MGILPNTIKKNSEEYSNNSNLTQKWVILDGPVDSVWVEDLNSLIDNNRKICDPSGDTF